MRLCALLGVPSRRILKHILTHRDYLDWQALYREDPWDQDRADLRAGIVAAAALAPYSKKGNVPRPGDFMPYVKRGPRRQSPEQIKEIATALAANWNKTVERMTQKKRKREAESNGK